MATWFAVSKRNFSSALANPAKGSRWTESSERKGKYGPRFQHALSLDIPSIILDGIVGPVTWQALVSGMLSG